MMRYVYVIDYCGVNGCGGFCVVVCVCVNFVV